MEDSPHGSLEAPVPWEPDEKAEAETRRQKQEVNWDNTVS